MRDKKYIEDFNMKMAEKIGISLQKAHKHVGHIAQNPHPRRSEEHKKVREYLIGKIKEAGLEPVVQTTRYTCLFYF